MDKQQYVRKLKRLKVSLLESSLSDSENFLKQYPGNASSFITDIKDYFNNTSYSEKLKRELDRVMKKEIYKIAKYTGHTYIDNLTAYAKNSLEADNFTVFKIYMNVLRKTNDVVERGNTFGPANIDYQVIRTSFILIGTALIMIAWTMVSCSQKISLKEIGDALKQLDIKKILNLLLKISYLGICGYLGAIGLCYIIIAIKNFDIEDEQYSSLVSILYNGMTSQIMRKIIGFGIELLNSLLKLGVTGYTIVKS